jgi:hypothetical protein
MFYDYATFALVEYSGENITLTDVNFTFLQARWALTCARQRLGRECNDRIPIFPNSAFLPSSRLNCLDSNLLKELSGRLRGMGRRLYDMSCGFTKRI